MNRAVLAIVAAIALTGCPKPVEDEPLGGWVDLTAPVRVDITPSTGPAPHLGLARAVNEFGAAVGSGPMPVAVDGSDVSVSFDPYGYGTVEIASAHSADVWSGDQNVRMTAVDGDWAGFGLMPSMQSFGTARHVQPGSGGMLAATDSEVYWVPVSGTPHRVLHFPNDTIGGLRTANLDGDGILDAVVWAGDTVAFMRGRPDGGLAWGGGVQLEGMIAGGVTAADVTNDDSIDVAIAWQSEVGDHVLQVWEGNGLFEFSDRLPADLIARPTGLAVGDNFGDGDGPQFTVMIDSDPVNWQRVQVIGEQILGVGPTLNDLGMSSGTDVFSGADLNDDGGDELFLFAPLVPGERRLVRIYDLRSDSSSVQFVPVEYDEAHLTVADGNDDGLVDLFALEKRIDTGDYKLMHLAWTGSVSGSPYSQRRAADLADHGPIAFTDLEGDGASELLVAGQMWSWHPGAITDGENGEWWSVDEPTWGSWDLFVSGPVAQADADSDGTTVEMVGMVIESNASVLKTWTITPGTAPTLGELRSTTLTDAAADGLDVAVCGTFAYALNDTHLSKVNLVNGTVVQQITTTGSRVACGAGPSASEAAVLDGSTVRLLDSALVEVGTEPSGDGYDVAIGGGEAATCTTEDCSIVYWNLGDVDGFATGTTGEASLAIGSDDQVLGPVGGQLAVWDVDGDGTDDLIAVDGGTVIGTYLSAGDGAGAGRFFHARLGLSGPAVVGDVTQDGEADLLLADPTGSLYLTLGL